MEAFRFYSYSPIMNSVINIKYIMQASADFHFDL